MPVPSRRPLNPLGVVLARLLEARKITDADFARMTGISKAHLSQMKRRAPSRLPRDVNVEKWIRLLRLSHVDAQALLEAAELSWSPKGIQELVTKLRRQL